MEHYLVTPPSGTVQTLAASKEFMRVDYNEDDAVITRLLQRADAWVEGFLRRKLLTQTWGTIFDCFPGRGNLEIPFPNVTAINSLKYKGSDGTYTVADPATYQKSSLGFYSKIAPLPYAPWPVVASHYLDPVVVEYTVGYGDAEDVPPDIIHAIDETVMHWYQNRSAVEVSAGIVALQVPIGVESILWNYRNFKFAA